MCMDFGQWSPFSSGELLPLNDQSASGLGDPSFAEEKLAITTVALKLNKRTQFVSLNANRMFCVHVRMIAIPLMETMLHR